MLVDFHCHLCDEQGYGEALAETAKNLGFDRLCIAGGDAQRGLASNAEVRKQADDYPDIFIPFAAFSLGEDGPGVVERFKRMGFEGLAVCSPPAPYDDEAFFPVYEAAGVLDMPIVFHTGFPPVTALDRARRVRAAHMRPVHLDTIARCFPNLTIVGIGLGSPWYDESAEVLRHHRNVFFDLSGDVLRRKSPEFIGSLLRPAQAGLWADEAAGHVWDRVLFGSATRHEEIASVERDYQRVFRSLAFGAADVAQVMGATAARLLGLDAGA